MAAAIALEVLALVVGGEDDPHAASRRPGRRSAGRPPRQRPIPTYPTPARSKGSRSSALRPSTKSSRPGRRGRIERPIRLVRRLEDGDAHRHARAELVRLEAELAQVIRREVRVVGMDARAGGEQLVAQAEGGAERVLVARRRGRRSPSTSTGWPSSEPMRSSIVSTVKRAHRLVDLGAPSEEAQVRLAVEEEVRVDRDAVAADADARLVDVAVRLRVGGADDLGDVDPAARREAGQLVGVGDVHVAVGRLGELRHLGGLGIGDRPSPRSPPRARTDRTRPRGACSPALVPPTIFG